MNGAPGSIIEVRPRRLFLGVDPGVDGALCVIDENLVAVRATVMPTIADGPNGRRLVDAEGIGRFLDGLTITMGALETIGARPGIRMGASSAITIGRNFGRIEDRLAALGVPFQLVAPQSWQKVVCAGTGDPKARSVAAAQRMLPSLDLMPGKRRVPHDGLADAGCLALHALRVLAGGFGGGAPRNVEAVAEAAHG